MRRKKTKISSSNKKKLLSNAILCVISIVCSLLFFIFHTTTKPKEDTFTVNAYTQPTVTEMPISGGISVSPIPSYPITTIAPLATSSSFTLKVCPHGLGNCGDNVRSKGGNANPQHATRSATLTFLNEKNVIVATASGSITYNILAKNFQGNLTIPGLAKKKYFVSVKTDGYLSKQIPGVISVNASRPVFLPTIFLVAGDSNNDNQLDIQDYNILISCFANKFISTDCLAPATLQSSGADMNDDGVVDGADYNLFLRELSVQYGNGSEPATITPSTAITIIPTPTSVLSSFTPTPTYYFVH